MIIDGSPAIRRAYWGSCRDPLPSRNGRPRSRSYLHSRVKPRQEGSGELANGCLWSAGHRLRGGEAGKKVVELTEVLVVAFIILIPGIPGYAVGKRRGVTRPWVAFA